MITISLIVNDEPVEATVETRTSLADFLREQLHLTGTHIGCEHGVCGACTVHLDGVSARSCITLAAACDGRDVKTIEGFETDPQMEAIRVEFSKEHALQCGYCTPGMLMTAVALATEKPDLTEADVRHGLEGNICRCTGYQNIVVSVMAGAAAMNAAKGE